MLGCILGYGISILVPLPYTLWIDVCPIGTTLRVRIHLFQFMEVLQFSHMPLELITLLARNTELRNQTFSNLICKCMHFHQTL